MDTQILRQAEANLYASKKEKCGHALEGFFLDVYKDLLSGELAVTFNTNRVVELMNWYKLHVSYNSHSVSVCDEMRETTCDTLEEAVYTFVAEHRKVYTF